MLPGGSSLDNPRGRQSDCRANENRLSDPGRALGTQPVSRLGPSTAVDGDGIVPIGRFLSPLL